MRIRLTDRQHAALTAAAETPGATFPDTTRPATLYSLVDLGYARPAAYGHPNRITPAGRAALAGDEAAALTWQRLTPTLRAVLCALADGRDADRVGPAGAVNAATFKRLAAAGFITTQGRNDTAHARLTDTGHDAVLRIRGQRPAFTRTEITEVYVDELCVNDSFAEYGRRWIVAFPPKAGGARVGDITVLAHIEGLTRNHPDYQVHTLSLPADRRLPR
ncbi:hypothetical protein LG943_12665 [Streptomonospora sp. S1-112]|uniref:Uncharacterized protein n=1 Tax=Streptomonospora mangrovi TaxID=2883123 RepID=A0A9X3NVS4_9ACTN|nr:hypothetical protein [Streptomonospora mangrovi]MDA0565161.1 hypothetical protein [Streptomonospora mangrovi]